MKYTIINYSLFSPIAIVVNEKGEDLKTFDDYDNWKSNRELAEIWIRNQ